MATVTATMDVSYGLYSRHIILMKEQLARYYRNKMVNALREFDSPTINLSDVQVTGITFGPTRRKETLYGSTVTMQFSFKGGDDWEK